MTEQRIPAAVPTDITLPVYITATTGAVTRGLTEWIGELPSELYLWVQLTVPLLMGYVAAQVRLRRAHTRPRQIPPLRGD